MVNIEIFPLFPALFEGFLLVDPIHRKEKLVLQRFDTLNVNI